jgi:hypothetical protein
LDQTVEISLARIYKVTSSCLAGLQILLFDEGTCENCLGGRGGLSLYVKKELKGVNDWIRRFVLDFLRREFTKISFKIQNTLFNRRLGLKYLKNKRSRC